MVEFEKEVPKVKKAKECFNKFESLKLEDESLKKEIAKVQCDYSDLNKKFDEYQDKSKKEKAVLSYLLVGEFILILVLVAQMVRGFFL